MPSEVAESVNVLELLRTSPTFGRSEVELLQKLLGGHQAMDVRQAIREIQSEVDQTSRPRDDLLARVGIGLYLLGRHEQADSYLARVADDSVATYYHALVLSALGRHEESAERFAQAGQFGFDPIECTLRQAGEVRLCGHLEAAEELLRSTAPKGATRAEYSYQMGCILADKGDTFGAIEYFERAVDMDPHHTRALFSLAGENALHGNDARAIQLYERALSRPPLYLGALLNLGLLYEDSEQYNAAAFCFRRILEVYPRHERARLYLKDIEAAGDMYYDEDAAREESRLQQLLNRPIADFELTVRSRNCLESIDINTLGDLTRVSEHDLLASKNFGETSLKEIRELMAMHNLTIGQNLHLTESHEPLEELKNLPPEQLSLVEKSISELNLSVRSRKCMTRLGISTLAELVRRTPDELLSTKNFGVTSLNEIRAKLDELGLKLRND